MEHVDRPDAHLASDFGAIRALIADGLEGFAAADRLLQSYEAGPNRPADAHVDMIATTLLTGAVDVHYRGRYISIPFRRLHEWFLDPVTIGAEHYQVAESAFRRWMNSAHVDGMGQVMLGCNHPGCKMERSFTFYHPHEMQEMERRAESEIWYCHHHRDHAWEESGGLGDEHLSLLVKIASLPGCNRIQLGGKKMDTDFLIRIGVLTCARPENSRRADALAFHLTDLGRKIVDTTLSKCG
ncbi:hypothetical protein ACS0Y3_15365 [Burkholderia gladioli]|uniref:hypothetical protein n=1 Tax=Burkholderia gladioli TaxID=28095 RepID=UPI003F79DF4B